MTQSTPCPACGAPAVDLEGEASSRCAYCGATRSDAEGRERRRQAALAEPVLGAHRTAVWAIGLVGLLILGVGGVSAARTFGAVPALVAAAFAVAWIAVMRSILKVSTAAQENLRRRGDEGPPPS